MCPADQLMVHRKWEASEMRLKMGKRDFKQIYGQSSNNQELHNFNRFLEHQK